VEFCFLKTRKPAMATSAALALLLAGSVGSPLVAAQAAPAQQPAAGAPGAPAKQKNYKDRGEYDLYNQAVQQAKDPKAQLQTLQTWQDKYPQTDFETERLQLFISALRQLAPSDPAAAKQLIERCNQLLKIDPKNFQANYFLALWGPRTGGASPSPDLESQVDTASHTVLDNLPPKPANMSDTDWDKAKGQIQAIAHNALAWEDVQKKDNAAAENEYKASLQADPSQAGVSATYAKTLIDDKKDDEIPTALFEYARAAQYDGPGALPADQRQKLMDYIKTQYQNFHGGTDGLDQMMAQAKTQAVPPDGFTIQNANALAQKNADALNARIASDPAFKIWYAIKQNLTDPTKGDSFFTSDVKDVEIPGGAEGVKTFSGTVISLDPADAPTKVVIGVEDPTKPDATLEFSKPLPPDALNVIKVGQKVDFSGIADSYNKDPYMLTFKDPTIPGVKTTTPARVGRKRH
jgi:hypothetical protein